MIFKRRDVVSALLEKGFRIKEKSGHTKFIYVTLNGTRPGITTYVSRGKKYTDLGDDLIGKMARQLKLQKKEFEQLILCTLKRHEYEKRIRRKL